MFIYGGGTGEGGIILAADVFRRGAGFSVIEGVVERGTGPAV